MPKHIIEFNIPEEQDELNSFLAAKDAHSVLYSLRNHLRALYKYAEYDTEEAQTLIDNIYKKFWEYCNDEGYNPYEH